MDFFGKSELEFRVHVHLFIAFESSLWMDPPKRGDTDTNAESEQNNTVRMQLKFNSDAFKAMVSLKFTSIKRSKHLETFCTHSNTMMNTLHFGNMNAKHEKYVAKYPISW